MKWGVGKGPQGEVMYQNIKGLGLLLSDKKFFPVWVYVEQVTPGAGPFLTPGL